MTILVTLNSVNPLDENSISTFFLNWFYLTSRPQDQILEETKEIVANK